MIVVSGWEKSHGFQVRLMQPISDWYVRVVRPEGKRRILDVASGTGIPALALAERLGPGGQLVAADVSSAMLGGLQRLAAAGGLSNIETRETSGAAIGGPDGAFDAVTCKDGLMFFPDIVNGLRELRRVLAPGGTYAFSVWAGIEHNPAFATLFGTLAAVTNATPPAPDAPGPFRLAAPGELERVLRAAGFANPAVERVAITWRFTSLAQHWQLFSETAGPLERAVATLPPSEVAHLQQKLAEAIAPFAVGDGFELPGLALCATGAR